MILSIDSPYITLSAALKLAGFAQSGGEAKLLILDGRVRVNGEVCLMRGKKLYPGDAMSYGTRRAQIGTGATP